MSLEDLKPLRCFGCGILASSIDGNRARCSTCGCSWEVDLDASDCWVPHLLDALTRQREKMRSIINVLREEAAQKKQGRGNDEGDDAICDHCGYRQPEVGHCCPLSAQEGKQEREAKDAQDRADFDADLLKADPKAEAKLKSIHELLAAHVGGPIGDPLVLAEKLVGLYYEWREHASEYAALFVEKGKRIEGLQDLLEESSSRIQLRDRDIRSLTFANEELRYELDMIKRGRGLSPGLETYND